MRRAVSRADLLRGRLAPQPDVIRPPYAVNEPEFRDRCVRCDDCRNVCRTGVIGQDAAGFPKLVFNQSGCSFCGACANACKTGALNSSEARAWSVKAQVDAMCLSAKGITCRTCEEACKQDAIRFKLMTGGRAMPLIDEAKCTGCGFCAAVCPTNSVDLQHRSCKEVYA